MKYLQQQEFEMKYGIDPGVNSLITAKGSDDSNHEFTTREYRHKSKFNYNVRKRQRWYKRWEHCDEFKAIPTFKTSSTKVMDQYERFASDYVLPKLDKFYKFHLDKNFRGLNFNAYCQNKRTLESISKALTQQHENKKNTKIILGFGDFSQSDGLGKKRPKAPILKIKHHLRQRCHVIDIENATRLYNTSKTCSCCHSELERYKNHTIIKYKRNGVLVESKRKRGVYTVIRCERFASYNECKLSCMNKTRSVLNQNSSSFVQNRDVNASINMLLLSRKR